MADLMPVPEAGDTAVVPEILPDGSVRVGWDVRSTWSHLPAVAMVISLPAALAVLAVHRVTDDPDHWLALMSALVPALWYAIGHRRASVGLKRRRTYSALIALSITAGLLPGLFLLSRVGVLAIFLCWLLIVISEAASIRWKVRGT